MAAKIYLEASGTRATDQTPGYDLATDRSQYRPETVLDPEMRTLFRKTGLQPGQSYSVQEVEQKMAPAGLDAMSRIAVKHFLSMSRLLRASGAVQEPSRVRDISASAERLGSGQILRDPHTGQPAVLRSLP
jgi:hypothetical protein